MTQDLDVSEFITGYLAEAEEHLSIARSCLTAIDSALQKKELSPKAVRELFRSVHTLKGLSAMVGAAPIVDITHELETLLRSADKAGGKLPPGAVDLVVKSLRLVEDRISELAKGQPLSEAPKSLLEALGELQFDEKPPPPFGRLVLEPETLAKLSSSEQAELLACVALGKRAVRVAFVPSHALSAEGINITKVRSELSKIGDLVKVLPRSMPQAAGKPASVAFLLLLTTNASDADIAAAAATTPEEVKSITESTLADAPSLPISLVEEAESDEGGGGDAVGRSRRGEVLRVDVRRLDEALDGLSALVVSRWRIERAVLDLESGQATTRDLKNLLTENARQLRDLRAAIMRARMVPVSELLERAPLLVRGLARSSNKLVRLTIEAGPSELDKAVVDRLFPVIVHLLRNAVDHALEAPEARRAAGKPEEGQLRISCRTQSATQLALVISDDGRGVDAEKVARRAGCEVPKTDAQLLALITRTGLSTLDQATHTSGRGLGMDIVKRVVEGELGGELRLRTERGKGTEFTLIVPLSVTIFDVFTFVSGGSTYVVPVSAVDDLTEIDAEDVSEAPSPTGKGAMVRLLEHRGSTLPLYRVDTLLGRSGESAVSPKAIIVRREAHAFAFEVDRMLGQKEVVVRPLRDPLVRVRGVSGSTDLGDGEPTLVLDLLSLLQPSTSGSQAS